MLTNRERMIDAGWVDRRIVRWMFPYNHMILINKILLA
jgi:hypothetical protein